MGGEPGGFFTGALLVEFGVSMIEDLDFDSGVWKSIRNETFEGFFGGEYGSVIFIAGNLPMKTEIASLLIVNRLDENDVSGASAIAIVMLASTLALLLAIQGLQWYVSRRTGRI